MEKTIKFTIGIIGKQWLFYNRNSLKNSTLQTYEYLLDKHISVSELSLCPIDEITSEDIIEYSEELLNSDLSPKTVNCILLTINSIFKFTKNKYGVAPPYIKYVKDIKKEMRVLTVAEQNQMELYIKERHDSYNLGILFALYLTLSLSLFFLFWLGIGRGYR